MSSPADIDQLRARARHLRTVARQTASSPALTVHRLAGPDTWVGPTPQWCLDELLAVRRRVEAARQSLDDAARLLERRADQLQRMPVA